MWPLLADEGILHRDASARRTHGKCPADLFGVRPEEGAVHGSSGGPRTPVPLRGMSKLPALVKGALPLTSNTDAWLISVEIERWRNRQ